MFWMVVAAVSLASGITIYLHRQMKSADVDPERVREAEAQYFESMKRFPW